MYGLRQGCDSGAAMFLFRTPSPPQPSMACRGVGCKLLCACQPTPSTATPLLLVHALANGRVRQLEPLQVSRVYCAQALTTSAQSLSGKHLACSPEKARTECLPRLR